MLLGPLPTSPQLHHTLHLTLFEAVARAGGSALLVSYPDQLTIRGVGRVGWGGGDAGARVPAGDGAPTNMSRQDVGSGSSQIDACR